MRKRIGRAGRIFVVFIATFFCVLIGMGPIELGVDAQSPINGIQIPGLTWQTTPLGGQFANAGTATILDTVRSQAQTWEIAISGTAPSTTSISIKGCMRGGTCGTATTSTSTTSTILNTTGLFDNFQVQISWTGGDATTQFVLNPTVAAKNSSGGSVMIWPAGGAGIANYAGGNTWGTSYSASNKIPAAFVSTLNQNTSGRAAVATTADALTNPPTPCTGSQLAQGVDVHGNATPCVNPPAGTIPSGSQGQPVINTTGAALYATSALYADASQFQVLTGSGAEDVCAEAVAAEQSLVVGNGSGGVVLVTVPRKAYCSEMPVASNFAGEVYFRGRSSRARIYTGVQWGAWKSDVKLFGVGQAGSTINNNVTNVELVACNPLLHDNTYPTNSTGAPCAGFFNSSTNMPQATVTSITAAAGGSSTITLSGALSGTPPSTFAGRALCIGKETASAAANGHCWEINAEPTGGGTIFHVNTTSMVACNATCGGLAYLETPLVAFTQSPTNGSTFYHSGMERWTLSCAYTYGCAEFVNGAGEEGTYLSDVQGFNGTVYGFRMFVGNNASPNAYGGDKGGASHSGPYTRIFHNFQAEVCEIFTGGCYGMNAAVSGGAVTQFAVGTQMMAGTPAIMPNTGCPSCTYAVLAYSSSVAISTMSKTFVGLISDGIAMGTNSQSIYGVNGSTMSLKDIQNSGTHAILPELTEGMGYFQVGPDNKFDGYHCEYAIICQEIGGMATHNETWIEDGATQTQGATWTNGDSNNDTTFNFELGSANGSSNIMNFSAQNMSTISGTPSTKMLKNNIQTSADCNVSTESNIWYVFAQTSTGIPLLLSDCSSAQNIIPTPLNNQPASYSFQGYCQGAVNATTGTYWIDPFQNSSVTSESCATLSTSNGTNFSFPITTLAGKCQLYARSNANATANVTFTVNNVTQSTSATSIIAAGANHHEVDAATLAFTKGDQYNVTITIGTSDAITNPRLSVVCW